MAKGFGAPKAPATKFKSHFQTKFVSKWGRTPKAPGPPSFGGAGKVGKLPRKPKMTKVGRI